MYADTPRVSIYPHKSNYTVSLGTKLFLYCTAMGMPTPTIQWYENSILIPQQTSSLYIVPTHTPHVTLYSCEAKNNAGNRENMAHANITVTVQSTWQYTYVCSCNGYYRFHKNSILNFQCPASLK